MPDNICGLVNKELNIIYKCLGNDIRAISLESHIEIIKPIYIFLILEQG